MKASVNGTKLFYVTHGSGPPMLVLHGGLGFDHTYLRPWLDPLGDQFQLIYYDHRGNGRSDRPPSLADVEFETWVEDAEALRAHLGHERVFLLGHSYGGALGLEYGIRHSDKLLGLILVSSFPSFDFPEIVYANARARATPEQLEVVENGLSKHAPDDETWRDLWLKVAPLYFTNYTPEVAKALDSNMMYSAAAFNRGFLECLQSFDVKPRLHEISAPTLVIGGAQDWITPTSHCAGIVHDSVAGSEMVVFEDSGHYPQVDESQKFLETVRGWTARLPR